jgi:OmpA-OmpF porin, OOP family
VFNFDRHTTAEMRPQSRAEVDELIAKLKSGIKVNAVKLSGHADRLNSTGNVKYNQQLSEKRAITVREYLVAAGVSPALISYEYKGDTEQVAQCDGKFKNTRLLEECLLPDRRVAIQVSGVR